MKALITGITGFAGSHLAEYLLKEGHEVFGIYRSRSPMENLTKEVRKQIKLIECELRDDVAVRSAIHKSQPDWIFHLAAQSFVPTSWVSPADTLSNNILGQLHIFEAIREQNLIDKTRVLIACSSEEYGMVYEDEVPIKETNPLRPLSPYAVSKVAQDMMGYQYHESYGLHVIRSRAFNHTGPRRGEMFVTSTFAQQVAMIESGAQDPVIKVGNLDARRDFTDARDTVRAYVALIQGGTPGEVYNICSGVDISIRELLDRFLKLSTKKIEVAIDPARLRPSDVLILKGDCSRLQSAVNWERQITLDQTLEDMLNYWRERV